MNAPIKLNSTLKSHEFYRSMACRLLHSYNRLCVYFSVMAEGVQFSDRASARRYGYSSIGVSIAGIVIGIGLLVFIITLCTGYLVIK